jgi:hypothetical protein
LALCLATSLLLAACGAAGGRATQVVFSAPQFTPTPLSEPLPTVATQVPFGVEGRPYRVIVVSDTGGGRALNDFLNEQTGRAFEVRLVETSAEGLALLCGEIPAFLFSDGLTMLAAQNQGCGRPALLVERGRNDQAMTGLRAEIIVASAARITEIDNLRERIFCRLNDQDVITWVLPVLVMRSVRGFDPFVDFTAVRDVPDLTTLLREVGEDRCVGAIPAGTLSDYTVPGFANITDAVSVLPGTTSPELPFGGLMVSERVPLGVAEQVARLFQTNPAELEDLIDADGLVEADVNTLAAMTRLLQTAGMSAFGQ